MPQVCRLLLGWLLWEQKKFTGYAFKIYRVEEANSKNERGTNESQFTVTVRSEGSIKGRSCFLGHYGAGGGSRIPGIVNLRRKRGGSSFTFSLRESLKHLSIASPFPLPFPIPLFTSHKSYCSSLSRNFLFLRHLHAPNRIASSSELGLGSIKKNSKTNQRFEGCDWLTEWYKKLTFLALNTLALLLTLEILILNLHENLEKNRLGVDFLKDFVWKMQNSYTTIRNKNGEGGGER